METPSVCIIGAGVAGIELGQLVLGEQVVDGHGVPSVPPLAPKDAGRAG